MFSRSIAHMLQYLAASLQSKSLHYILKSRVIFCATFFCVLRALRGHPFLGSWALCGSLAWSFWVCVRSLRGRKTQKKDQQRGAATQDPKRQQKTEEETQPHKRRRAGHPNQMAGTAKRQKPRRGGGWVPRHGGDQMAGSRRPRSPTGIAKP